MPTYCGTAKCRELEVPTQLASQPQRSQAERAAMRVREEERVDELRQANPEHPLICPPETD